MGWLDVTTLIGIGLFAGVCAGMFGIGGGLIIVPALLLIMKLPELQAIGTSLGVIATPVVLLGAIQHYRAGNLIPKYAILIALGLFIGAYFGAKLVIGMPPALVRRVYAIFLVIIAGRMLLWGK
ncbi:MAG: sulfite exporter TauE/SafE family protein [Rhodospirillales bacterium]|nr:sulfite exporter TauE/SafE family protein [Rhodospirillales bacterium]